MRYRLKAQLSARHNDVLTRNEMLNPITEFYGAPLAEVSPASGLSLSYYRNFVRHAVGDILNQGVIADGQPVPEALRKNVRLQVWIPDRLAGAFHQNIQHRLVESGRLVYAQIRQARPLPLYALSDQAAFVTLVDVPTALNAMEYAVAARYSASRLDKSSEEWRQLEAQEIERFSDNLTRLLRNEDDPNILDVVSIHSWATDTGVVTPRSKLP